MECIGFFTSARGQDALLGLPLFLWAQGTVMRMTPIFKPHQLPPSPCVRTARARAVIVPASIAISTCPFRLALIAAISRMLIMTFGFCARLFRFDDLFSFAFLWSLNLLFIWRFFVLRFLPDLHWVLGFSRVFLVYTVCFCDGLESLFIFAYLC